MRVTATKFRHESHVLSPISQEFGQQLARLFVRIREIRVNAAVEMIVCVLPSPGDTARLLDYSVNFTAR
jgi:hypothetical protein